MSLRSSHQNRGIPRSTPRNNHRVFNALPSHQPPLISRCCSSLFQIFFGNILKTLCSFILIIIIIVGNTEYQRLVERASVFHKKWNPIAESFDEFYETEKRSAKKSLFAQWHGANSFYDFNTLPDMSLTNDKSKEMISTSPTLRELLTMPSRHPFRHPLDATKFIKKMKGVDKIDISKTTSKIIEPPLQRIISDVTLILNHFKRNTLEDQLLSILNTFSVLPKGYYIYIDHIALAFNIHFI